jgi:HEAT repeat protein
VITENFLKGTEKLTALNQPKDTLWPLANIGKDAVPVLKQMLETAKPEQKFFPAVALAMHKRREAIPELVKCVSERNAVTLEGWKAAPRWKSAIVMLGRIKNRKALPVLTEVLFDGKSDVDALIAAVRAIGRIGDKKAVPVLLKFLKRKNLPKTRDFQTSCSTVKPVKGNVFWQLELAVAESLASLGRSQKKIIKKYLGDPRVYVRRYANKIQSRV